MGKPHPIELRARAVALVKQGNMHTETARRLCVSIKFVNVKWSGKTGQRAKMYPALMNGYKNDEATELFRQV